MPSEPPMVGAVQLFPRPPITAVYRTATGWDALTTCTVASICCGLPYSQSIRSCIPSDDPPASLRKSGCSGASNPSSSGYVLGSLQRPTMADLLSANRDAFGATLRPSLLEGVMKPSNRKANDGTNNIAITVPPASQNIFPVGRFFCLAYGERTYTMQYVSRIPIGFDSNARIGRSPRTFRASALPA